MSIFILFVLEFHQYVREVPYLDCAALRLALQTIQPKDDGCNGTIYELPPNLRFPCADRPKRFSNQLIVREAQEDMWHLVKKHLVDREPIPILDEFDQISEFHDTKGFLILGSAGAGKVS